MLCVVIKGPTFEEAFSQIAKASRWADLIELRLDLFSNLATSSLALLRSKFPIPMIFTLRSPLQGGGFYGTEEERKNKICELLCLRPEYIDLEADLSIAFTKKISSLSPTTRLIISTHDFEKTPDSLEDLFTRMKLHGASYYKIAVKTESSTDLFQFLEWAQPFKKNLIPVCMGKEGQPGRILTPYFDFPWTYASLDAETATPLFQVPAHILKERYRHKSSPLSSRLGSLNPNSSLFGLIGDPIEKSISDRTHNQFFSKVGKDAVYLKLRVQANELADFLKQAKRVPFRGFSVTMPLKEMILPLLDEADEEALKIGAVNTLVLQNGKYKGFNTDGFGALEALEKKGKVKGKSVVLLGAGGTAKAIAFEAIKRGASVTLLNRDVKRAQEIANQLSCEADSLENLDMIKKKGVSFLINCTPVSLPHLLEGIDPTTVVMDVVSSPKETTFLKEAQTLGCPVVYGIEMFFQQAFRQFKLWLIQ